MPAIPNAFSSVNVDGRTSRTRDYVAGPAIVGPQGKQGPPGQNGRDGASEDVYRANATTEYECKADGVTDDTAALNALFASGASHVFIPPGTYYVAGAVTASADYQFVRMAPGAEFLINPATGSLTFSGARMRLSRIQYRIAVGSTRTFSPLLVSGARTLLDGATLTINADVQNASLLQLGADDVRARDIQLASNYRFLRGVSITKADDSSPFRVVVDGVVCSISPSTAKDLGSIVNSHGAFALIRDLAVNTSDNTTYSEGVVRIRASNCTLDNPQIVATGAQYGVYGEDSASEKLTILQGTIHGRNNGTFVANSEGIRVGHQSGHQKLYGTFVNGWTNGVVFHGSADNPGFYGAIIANNSQYAFVIDAPGAAVRGLNIIDCYLSDVNQHYCMHLVNGRLEGCVISGSEIGFDDVAILVEESFINLEGMVIQGCFIQGGLHSATALGVIQPSSTTADRGILFINNKPQGIGALSYGTYASKAVDIFDPVLTGLTIGATGSRMTRQWSVTAALSFPTSLGANQHEDKVATVTGVAVGDDVRVSVPDDVVYPGDHYMAWVSGANFVTVRRSGNGEFGAAASGTFRFTVTKYS